MQILIFGFFIFLSIFDSYAACTSKRDTIRKTEAEKTQLTLLNFKLTQLLDGKWNISDDVNTLFTTNILTTEEQELRREEIEKSLNLTPYKNPQYQSLIECLEGHELGKLAEELSSLSYEVDKKRYFFLFLPFDIQKILLDTSKPITPVYEDIRLLQERILTLKQTSPSLALQEEQLLRDVIKRLESNLETSSAFMQLSNEYKAKGYSTALFDKANQLWRRIVDKTFNTLKTTEIIFPEDHLFPKREAELKKEADQWIQKGIERHYLILVKAGKLRSQLAEKNINKKWQLSDLEDIQREVKIVPYRFTGIFYSKIVDFKQKLRLGVNGIGLILRDVVMLILIILIPFALKRLFDRITSSLDLLRSQILHSRTTSTLWKAAAIWIQRLKTFVPWFFWYLALILGEKILNTTALAELSALFPYFKYYVLYKVFRRFVMLFLTSLSARSDRSISIEIKLKATEAAKGLGLFAFFSFSLIHVVDSVVSKGLIYEILILVIKVFALIQTLRWSARWAKETSFAIKSHLGGKYLKFIEKAESIFPVYLYCIPWLFISVVLEALSFIKDLGSDFDLSKRLSAQVFKRQLENVEEFSEDGIPAKLPKEYLNLFPAGIAEDESILIEPQGGVLEKINAEIAEWKEGKSDEHSIALYGDKGGGKSTALAQVMNKHQDLRIISADIPAKLVTRDQTLKFFTNLLQADLSDGGRSLIEVDKELEPTLILLDETQNLFLSRTNGFEGYKALLELIGTRTKKIFWVASFNRYSWAFLNAVFGKNQHFRMVIKVYPWKDEDIKNLILKRHKKGPYQLSYDAIIQAVGSSKAEEAAAAIESKFFKLLWEQSGGNPRAAQDLWLSSLHRIRAKTLRVGLPDDPELSILGEISDDALFIYAALIRHENLSTIELVDVTDLPEGTVRYALRLGLENEYLKRSKEGRYRVAADSQRKLITYLRKRNFIYGG